MGQKRWLDDKLTVAVKRVFKCLYLTYLEMGQLIKNKVSVNGILLI